MKPVSLLLFVLAALWYTPSARAADPCPQLRTQLASTDIATRIAAVACQENHAWFRPFIDADGRAGGQTVYEAENDALADGAQAWRKVAAYWSGSGMEPTIPMRGMREASKNVPNYTSFMFGSNQQQPLHIPMNGRRYNVANYQPLKLPRPDD